MHVDKRHATHPDQVIGASTAKLREYYHVAEVFRPGELCLTFSHIERMVVGGAMPVAAPVVLEACPALTTGAFLARRELGVINVGGPGTRHGRRPRLHDDLARRAVRADGYRATSSSRPTTQPIRPSSISPPRRPMRASTPCSISIAKAKPLERGAPETSNERTIYQYIVPGQSASSASCCSA